MNKIFNWLEALKLPLKVQIALALSTWVLFCLKTGGMLDLKPFGAYASPILVISMVIFSMSAIVGVIDYMLAPIREKRRQSTLSTRRAVRRKETEEQLVAKKISVLAHLDHLSPEEIYIVADSLRKGTPTFYTYVHSPSVAMLIGKRLVWTTGGQHNENHYPFSFHDYVWEALLARKDEFLAKDEEYRMAEAVRKERERRRY